MYSTKKLSLRSMKSLLYIGVILILTGTIFSSCANRKNMAYFQPGESDSVSTSTEISELIYEPGDFLHIQVSGIPEELSAIYNPNTSVSRESAGGSYRNDNAQTTGYLIDKEGFINFPVLGKIEAGGTNKSQLEETIVKKLKHHIDNPIINIRLRNFKVTVLGDVDNPGTFTIANERITLLEAIGIAGDLNITARRKNILLVREVDGEKKQYRVDLTKNDLFDSPYYYLKQNDVIYVEPNRTKLNTSKYSPVYSVIISVTSLVITTIVLITN
jgi:polysaccharide export outer membrane protein